MTNELKSLTSFSEKKKLVRSFGVDVFICVPFNEKISKLSPRDFFVDILVNQLNAKHIFCGFNYRFGYKGSGDVELLRLMCDEFDIELTVFDEIKLDDVTVSSSAIRSYLLEGELEKAEKMLGRPFSLYGKIKDGQHLGRKLGFPTINQELSADKLLIKNGVYLTRVRFGKSIKYGITNIGWRPTVDGKFPICETHILDFSGNLYGKYVTVEFLKFIREEKKFNSLEELTAQVQRDMDIVRKIIKK
jgi:riboflavin kinase/FMN adenylyltransferase